MHYQDIRLRCDEHDRGKISDRIEAQLVVQAHIDREHPVVAEQHRVAVGRAARDDLGSDVSASAGTIVDYYRLAEALRKAGGDNARHGVAGATRRETEDKADRPGWVLLRVR